MCKILKNQIPLHYPIMWLWVFPAFSKWSNWHETSHGIRSSTSHDRKFKNLSKNDPKKSVEDHFDRFSPKNRKTHQLCSMNKQQLGTLGIFCLSSFKSNCRVVFKTPLTSFKAIFLVNLVAVQSLEIFKKISCAVFLLVFFLTMWSRP